MVRRLISFILGFSLLLSFGKVESAYAEVSNLEVKLHIGDVTGQLYNWNWSFELPNDWSLATLEQLTFSLPTDYQPTTNSDYDGDGYLDPCGALPAATCSNPTEKVDNCPALYTKDNVAAANCAQFSAQDWMNVLSESAGRAGWVKVLDYGPYNDQKADPSEVGIFAINPRLGSVIIRGLTVGNVYTAELVNPKCTGTRPPAANETCKNRTEAPFGYTTDGGVKAGNVILDANQRNTVELVIKATDTTGIRTDTTNYLDLEQQGAGQNPDTLVTFVGKFAVRARDALNWVLAIDEVGTGNQVIVNLYQQSLNIVNGLLIVALLVIAVLWNFQILVSRSYLRRISLIFVLVAVGLNLVLGFNRLALDMANVIQKSVFHKVENGKVEAITASDILAIRTIGHSDFIGTALSDFDTQRLKAENWTAINNVTPDNVVLGVNTNSTVAVSGGGGFTYTASGGAVGTITPAEGAPSTVDTNAKPFITTGTTTEVANGSLQGTGNVGGRINSVITLAKEDVYADRWKEPVWFNTALVFITSLLHWAIVLILYFRLVIIWFFLIFSPFLLLFLIFKYTRGYFRYWIWLYTRWFFIGPILAFCLSILVNIWIQTGVPVDSRPLYQENIRYISPINIFVAAPKITSGFLQNPTEMMKYIGSLLMLLVAIVLPFWLTRRWPDCGRGKEGSSWLTRRTDKTSGAVSGGDHPQSPRSPGPSAGGTGLAKQWGNEDKIMTTSKIMEAPALLDQDKAGEQAILTKTDLAQIAGLIRRDLQEGESGHPTTFGVGQVVSGGEENKELVARHRFRQLLKQADTNTLLRAVAKTPAAAATTLKNMANLSGERREKMEAVLEELHWRAQHQDVLANHVLSAMKTVDSQMAAEDRTTTTTTGSPAEILLAKLQAMARPQGSEKVTTATQVSAQETTVPATSVPTVPAVATEKSPSSKERSVPVTSSTVTTVNQSESSATNIRAKTVTPVVDAGRITATGVETTAASPDLATTKVDVTSKAKDSATVENTPLAAGQEVATLTPGEAKEEDHRLSAATAAAPALPAGQTTVAEKHQTAEEEEMALLKKAYQKTQSRTLAEDL